MTIKLIFRKNKKYKPTDERNPFRLKFNLYEKIIIFLLFLAAAAAVVFSAAILYTLVEGSFGFFNKINFLDFLIGTVWSPSSGKFGVIPLLSVTFLVAIGALAIGIPLGIAAAVYLSEFASDRIRSITKPILEILAGIPSIVYAFFALLFISPIFRNLGASYFNIASAILVIAIMIMPIIISISDDSMKAVPRHLRETSLALGATKWETAIKVVLPSASSGIIASILLALARALGETVVVLLVAGSIPQLTLNPFEEGMTMSAYIAQTATGDIPPGLAVSAAFAVGILLFFITYSINSLASKIVIQIKTGTSVKSKAKKKDGFIKNSFRIFSKLKKVFLTMLYKIKNKLYIKREFSLKKRYRTQRIGVILVAGSIIFSLIFLILLLTNVFSEGISGINLTFLTSYPSRFPEKAGIFPAIAGSFYLMLLTILFAAPLGIGAAIYLNEFSKETRFTKFLRRIIQNLAGVPSIVFGLMGVTIFVGVFGFGRSLLAGSLILTIMVMPIIVVATEEALKSVPDSFREAARGVGSTKWQTVRHHVLPYAMPGIFTGLILSLSRAIGETAPILFIAAVFGKSAPSGIMDGFLALPTQIFYWIKHYKHDFQTLAASTIIILLIILLSMNAIAIYIRYRTQKKRNW